MTPQELKASILQRAIQGRLVEQLPTETLSESIAANALDRNREDIPFEIPDTWCWCYLEDIATLHNGRAYKKPEMLKNGKYPLLRVGNLFTSDTWYYSDMELEPEKYCDNGDLLYAWSASFGPHIWNGGKVIYHYHIWKVELRHPQMRDYMYWALAAQTDAIKRRGHGLTMIHITKAGTEKMLIPVPQIAEQKRIVAKIEELLPYIDRYEKAWNRLEDLNKRFPADMQKSILQMAIQGKLVEQRPEEGTAEELYKQIQKEKKKLIKEGKIKKEKTLPEITEDEIPFDIPDSWKWVRLSQLFSVLNGDRGKNYPAKSTLSHEGIPFISALNLDGKSVIEDDNLLRLSEQQYERLGNGKLIRDDIVVCIRGSLGKHGRYPFDKGAIASSLVILRAFTNDDILAEFLMMYLDTPLFFSEIRRYDNGTAQPNLAAKSLEQFLVPLPPLAEQKRIVAKLEEILPMCDKLK